jgi:hypothetical protein
MHRLYFILIISKLEYASVFWNSITSTDAKKLERIQQRFSALCFNRFFPEVHYSYSLSLEEIKLHTLRTCITLCVYFLIQMYIGPMNIFCPVLEIVGLQVPAWYIRDFALFNVCSSCKIVLLLDMHQLLMIFAETLTYSQTRTFFLIMFCNML